MPQAQKIVESAEITVDSVWQPKPGNKWGNIKTTTGDAYFGPPAMLARFQKGESCKIEYTLGGTNGTLKALKQKIEIPQVLQRPAALAPRARTNPTDSEQIFVTALMKEIVKGIWDAGGGTTDLIAAVNQLRDAYRNTFGGSERQRDDQMNDEIKF